MKHKKRVRKTMRRQARKSGESPVLGGFHSWLILLVCDGCGDLIHPGDPLQAVEVQRLNEDPQTHYRLYLKSNTANFHLGDYCRTCFDTKWIPFEYEANPFDQGLLVTQSKYRRKQQ